MGEEHRIEALLQELLTKVTRVEAYLHTHHDRLKTLEDNQKWLWRTLVGSLIGAMVAYFINKG